MASTLSQIWSAAMGRASPLKPGSIPLVNNEELPAMQASANFVMGVGSAAGG
jgi:hypothetical protein